MVELELQASIDRSIQASLTGYSIDFIIPSSIDDEEMEESSQDLPESRPWEQYTLFTFLAISQDSIKLRQTLTSLINDPSRSILFEDVLIYKQELMQKLDALPRWTDYDNPKGEGNTLPPSFLPQILLDIQLR